MNCLEDRLKKAINKGDREDKKTLTLYHYSKAYIPDRIEPLYFGNHSYTRGDMRTCGLARTFYYIQGDFIPEVYIKHCKYKYIVKIDKNKIYDLKKDKNGLINRFKNIGALLYYIKKHYIGCIYNIGYDVAILFEAMPYKQVINRGV